MPEPSTVNQDQAAFWNAAMGRTWVELQDLLDGLFAPVAARIVEAGFPGEGGRVLDIGCGAGATTLAMARRVGSAGRCTGVDISTPLVEAASRNAREAGLSNAAFLCADAQTHAFEPGSFDAAVSRFGVMFFEDPTAAFANIRRAVRPGGRLAFAAWRSPTENPFMTTAGRAAAPFLPEPPPVPPDAPGQFGFARAERMREILEGAGWTGLSIEPLDAPGALPAADLDVFFTRMGPVALALQALDESVRPRALETVRRAFDPFVSDGAARFDMACWLVTARV